MDMNESGIGFNDEDNASDSWLYTKGFNNAFGKLYRNNVALLNMYDNAL